MNIYSLKSLSGKNSGSIAEKKRTSQWSKETYGVETIEKKLGHFWVKPRIFEKMSIKSMNHKKCCFL